MRRILPFLTGALGAAAWATAAQAGTTAPFLPGTRPLGMGNAFVAVVDDRNALHYNPAGLTRLERTHIAGLGLRAGVDDQFLDLVRFVQDHEDEFTNFDALDTQFLDELAKYDDRWTGADANAFLDVTRPSFGVGGYGTAQARVKLDRGVYEPRITEDAVSDLVGLVGGSMSLERFDLSVGGSLKGIWRRESLREITARDAANFDFNQIVDDLQGADPGFSMDLGALWAPATAWSAGAVLRDGTGWIGGERIESSLDVGTAWNPLRHESGLLRSVLLAADIDHVGGGGSFGNQICLGAEVRIPLLAVRTGSHQGYATAGASLTLPGLQVDYAYWGRELGDFPGAEPEFLHTVEIRLGT